MFDLVALRLAFVDRAAKKLECFNEECGDKMRLKPAGVGPFHVLADCRTWSRPSNRA